VNSPESITTLNLFCFCSEVSPSSITGKVYVQDTCNNKTYTVENVMRVKHPINNLTCQYMLHTVTDTPHLSMDTSTIGVVYNYNKKTRRPGGTVSAYSWVTWVALNDY